MGNLEAIEQEMRSLGWWYQHFELPNGLRTGNGQEPGYDAKARWNFIAATCPGRPRRQNGAGSWR